MIIWHLHSFLQAFEELVHVFLWDVPIQVSQVGIKLDKSSERDPCRTTLFILCQDLAGELQRSHEALTYKEIFWKKVIAEHDCPRVVWQANSLDAAEKCVE